MTLSTFSLSFCYISVDIGCPNNVLGYCFQVGLDGEKNQIYTEKGSQKVQWIKAGPSQGVTWYKVIPLQHLFFFFNDLKNAVCCAKNESCLLNRDISMHLKDTIQLL